MEKTDNNNNNNSNTQIAAVIAIDQGHNIHISLGVHYLQQRLSTRKRERKGKGKREIIIRIGCSTIHNPPMV